MNLELAGLNTEQLPQLLMGFGVVTLLLALALFLLRALTRGIRLRRNPRRIAILETHSLGPKHKLVLIRLDERDILLGVSANEIRSLHPLAAETAAAQADAWNARRDADWSQVQ